jgi:hypothetical protein
MEVFLIALVMIGLAFLAIGIKLIFNKNARLPAASCSTSLNENSDMICGCGTGACGLATDKSIISTSRKHDVFESE